MAKGEVLGQEELEKATRLQLIGCRGILGKRTREAKDQGGAKRSLASLRSLRSPFRVLLARISVVAWPGS